MPVFRYTAVGTDKKTIIGFVEADDEDEAARTLYTGGAVPISITSAAQQTTAIINLRQGVSNRTLKQHDLIDVLSYLTMLLAAGMTSNQALGAAARLIQKRSVRDFLIRVQTGVQKGQTLSQAFNQADPKIDGFVIDSLKAGEIGGQLSTTIEALEKHLKRFQTFQSEITSALIYPTMLLVMAVASLVLLFLVVIPEFKPLFENAGQNLPPVTRFVLSASDWLERYFIVCVIGLAVIAIAVRQYLRTSAGRLAWHRFKMQAPLGLGSVITQIQISAMARLMALLLKNGVPMLNALAATASAIPNEAFRKSIHDASLRVREGARLSDSLDLSGLFPQVFLDLIRVGEDASNLDWALSRLADLCEANVDQSLKRFIAAFVPVLTIILGALIAGVISSVLLALLSANQLAF